MILVYCHNESTRLLYTLQELFNPVGINVLLTNNIAQYNIYQGLKFKYDNSEDPLAIPSTQLLFEESLSVQTIKMVENFNGDWDVLAATFYLLSQYDEYQTHERDEFGRLAASTFLHVRKGLHRLPLVDLWRIDILKWLNSHYSDFNWELNCYKNCLTIDVDSAYAYLYKGWYRTLGGFAKDFLNLKFKNSLHRLLTLLRLRSDDFDTYKIIQQLEKYKNLEVTYFFLLADFKGEDVNISHRSWGMKRLIEKLSITNKIGIHPGIYSHEEFEKLAIEVSRLEKLLRKKVKDSRQHYLKFSFPEDAHRLNKLEIETDYSCGFFDETGYKNGTTLPVRFFDLSSNTVLQLRIQSFFAMDAALIRYMKWNKSEIIQHLREERLKCEARGLPYILLWHNESFSNKFVWKGWGNVLEEVYSN